MSFIARHKENNPVPEDNTTMVSSYLVLDEQFRFLDCENSKAPSQSLLNPKVSVSDALKQSGFKRKLFVQRGGDFYQKEMNGLCGNKDLEF